MNDLYQCVLAAEFGFRSPAQNSACLYEWLFAAMGWDT